MLDNKVIIDLDDYVDDIDVDLSDVVIAEATPPILQNKTINPTTSQQTITADVGYNGLGTVTINAVTSAIDNNIQPSNIKKDVTILGVTGTLESGRVDVVQNYNGMANYSFALSNITSYENTLQTSTIHYCFINCQQLKSANIPNTIKLESSVFDGCISLENVTLNSVLYLGSYNFNGCVSIKELSFPSLTAIQGGSNFYGCSKLNEITLGANQVCTISNTNNFTNAGTSNDNPSNVIYIYVPSSLIETYKTTTNWSTLYNNGRVDFLAIQ